MASRLDSAWGVVNATISYYEDDPHGNTTPMSDPMATNNPFRFSTKYTDDESGLVYYGQRFYSPSMGRWLSRDPMEEQGGFNVYVMVRNNPIQEIDPLGLMEWEEKWYPPVMLT